MVSEAVTTAVLLTAMLASVTCYTWEAWFYHSKQNLRSRSAQARQNQLFGWTIRIPRVAWLICSLLGLLRSFEGNQDTNDCSTSSMSADIGGTAVLIGLFIPALVACLSLLVGRFHTRESGTKELGITVLTSKPFSDMGLLVC